MSIYTKLDYKILSSITKCNKSKNKGISKVNGTKIKEVMEYTSLSEGKVRTTVNMFLKDGLLQYGVSDGRTRTYCITNDGLRELREIYECMMEDDGNEQE